MKKRLVALILVLVILVPCAASAAAWYRINTKLRLFYLPDYNSIVLDEYRQDWALTVGKSVDKNWSYITFSNGISGYLEKKFIVRDKSFSAWITKDSTPLKHGPADIFANEGSLNRGDRVTVLTHGKNFSYVKASVGYGYISNGLLSKKKVAPTKTPSSSKKVNYTAWVVSRGGTVGLRTAASGSDSVVFAKYAPGTKVTVLEEVGDFCYVSVPDGNAGFMRTKYLSKNQPAPIPDPSPAPAPVSNYPYNATAVTVGSETKVPVYQGEGLGWSVVIRLDPGAAVRVTAAGKDPYWVKVSINEHAYYMRKQNLR